MAAAKGASSSSASSSKASTSSKTSSTSVAKSTGAVSKPKTITNAATGKSITVTNVNSLTPAQRISLANALKTNQITVALANRNRFLTESSDPGMYGDDSPELQPQYMPSKKEVLAVQKSGKAGEILQQFGGSSGTFKPLENNIVGKKNETPKKSGETLNPTGKIDVNTGNQTQRTLNAAQQKILIDKYNSFETEAEAESWKNNMLQGLSAKGYDTSKAFQPNTVAAIVGDKVVSDAQKEGSNPIKGQKIENIIAVNAAKAMVTDNLTPEQKKEKAQQYVINEIQKQKAEGATYTQKDIDVVKSVLQKLGEDPSIVGKNKDNSNVPDQYKQVTQVVAPNGKPYALTTDKRTGQVEFTAKDGSQQKYNNMAEAMNKINSANPKGSVNDGGNKPQAQNIFGFNEVGFDPETGAYIDNPTGQTIIDQQNNTKDANMDAAEQAEIQKKAQLQQLIEESQDISDDQKAIVNQRLQGVYDSFSNINAIMEQLRQKSLQLFDQKATRSADARAKQLADKGYLMDDQAAAVSQYSLADYKRDIEVQKAEIEKTLAEKSIEIEQEKAKAIDAIQKDSSLNQQQKLTQINYLNQVYGSIVDDIANKKIAINDSYNQNITTVLSSPYQQDVQLSSVQKQEDAKNATLQDQKRRAATDDTARTQYISSMLTTQAPDAAPFAAEVIGDLISKNGVQWYLSRNIDALVGTVSNLARAKQIQQQSSLRKATK